MKTKKWRGAMLYLAIMAATSTLVGLRTDAIDVLLGGQPSSFAVPSRPGSTGTSSPSRTSSGSRTSAGSPSTSRQRVKTVRGDVVQTQYGPVQVSVTFLGRHLTDVSVLQTPSSDGRSRSIADRAVPTLHDEVLASQSAKIDTVSGATYTSDGYAQSVQSAIDRLGH